MEFSRQEYWSGLPFPTPGDLPDSGIELMCPALASRFFTTGTLGKPPPSRQLPQPKGLGSCLTQAPSICRCCHLPVTGDVEVQRQTLLFQMETILMGEVAF